MIKKLFIMWRLVHDFTNTTLVPCHAWTPWFLMHECFMLCCRPGINICIYICILNDLLVTKDNMLIPLPPAMVYSQIRTLMVLLGRKLQLIPLAHGLCRHHMVLWNSLLLLVLTPLLILSRLHKIFKKFSSHIASPFEHTKLFWYPWPMWVIYDNVGKFTGFAFQQVLGLLKMELVPSTNNNSQQMLFASKCLRLMHLCWKHFCLSNHHKHAVKLCCLWMVPGPKP